jgi:hypothetical protein
VPYLAVDAAQIQAALRAFQGALREKPSQAAARAEQLRLRLVAPAA